MSLRKISVSGRASILALAALAVLVLAGCLVLVRKASAQGGGRRAMAFAPVMINPPDPVRGGGDSLLIGLLLPAVQRGSTPFRVEAAMGDGSVAVLTTPPEPIRSSSFFDVFLEANERDQGFTLHLRNRKTGEEATAQTADTGITVRILPAVQDGDATQPLAAGLTVSGFRNARMGDGSVLPIPFQYGFQSPPEPVRG